MKRVAGRFVCALSAATVLVAAGVPLSEPAIAAKQAAVAGHGDVLCVMEGRLTYKPASRYSDTTPPVIGINAKLSECGSANEGAVAGGTLKGTFASPSSRGCAVFPAPLDGSVQLTVTWKTKQPAPKLLPTTATGGTGSSVGIDPDSNAVVSEKIADTTASGSFAASRMSLDFVFDVDPNPIFDACNSKKGLRSISFKGVNGTSTMEITPNPKQCPTSEEGYVVDAVNGSDTNTGGCDSPYKTITKALSISTPGYRVAVRPGIYDVANGEDFPLVVDQGVNLEGDAFANPSVRATRGMEPLTEIRGPVETIGVIPSRLANLWFRGGVRLTAGVEVRNSTLAVDVGTNADCADLRGGGTITQSTISGCWTGVDIEDGGTGVVALSKITNNRLNVLVTQGASADLGGGALQGRGHNVFSCGSAADLLTTRDVSARQNRWDHVPPTEETSDDPTDGTDVVRTASGISVDTAGATIAPANCP